jgi:CheY-like chemotaxis protein
MDTKTKTAQRYVVVVVEDEADIRLIAVEALADAGFDVYEAEHADEAVAILHERAREIHALFTDINMAGSMDGVALARHSHHHWPWIVLLLASGRPSPRPEDLPKGSRFVPKPYHPDHVVSHLRAMLTA